MIKILNLKIESIKTNTYLFNPYTDTYNMNKIRIKFGGSFLNRFLPSIIHGKIVNIYIDYEINDYYNDNTYPTLENCLFGSVKLIKNTDINKYKYFGYGIGFDRNSFSIDNEIARNIIIFGVDMSSSAIIGNQKKDILILGKGFTQGLEHTLAAEKLYSINFTKRKKKYKILFKFAL